MLRSAKTFGDRADNGWFAATKLAIAARDADRAGAADETHAGRLIDDLIEAGMLAEKTRQPGVALAASDLRHRLVRITDLGWKWWAGQIDPVPGIDDGRDA
jgi:hypothetical protein